MSSNGNGNGNGSSCLVPSVLVRPSEGTSKTIVKLGSIPADAGSLNVRIEEELKGIRLVPVEIGSDAADWPFVVRGPVVDASADRPHQVFICIEIDAAYEYVDLYITVVGDDSQANGELFRIPIVVVDESNDAAKAQQPMTQLQLGAMATTAMANWRLLQQRQAAQAAEAADHVIQTTDEPIVEALVLSETAREPGSTDPVAGGATTAGGTQPTDAPTTIATQPTAAATPTAVQTAASSDGRTTVHIVASGTEQVLVGPISITPVVSGAASCAPQGPTAAATTGDPDAPVGASQLRWVTLAMAGTLFLISFFAAAEKTPEWIRMVPSLLGAGMFGFLTLWLGGARRNNIWLALAALFAVATLISASLGG